MDPIGQESGPLTAGHSRRYHRWFRTLDLGRRTGLRLLRRLCDSIGIRCFEMRMDVVSIVGQRTKARRDVNDERKRLRTEPVYHRFADHCRTQAMRFKVCAQILDHSVFDRYPAARNAGVVDQHVDRLEDTGERRADCRLIADVRCEASLRRSPHEDQRGDDEVRSSWRRCTSRQTDPAGRYQTFPKHRSSSDIPHSTNASLKPKLANPQVTSPCVSSLAGVDLFLL